MSDLRPPKKQLRAVHPLLSKAERRAKRGIDSAGISLSKFPINSNSSQPGFPILLETSTSTSPPVSGERSQLRSSSFQSSGLSSSYSMLQGSHSDLDVGISHPRPGSQKRADDQSFSNMELEGNFVYLHELSNNITANNLDMFLRNAGFTAPLKILLSNDRSVSLEFTHSYVASAAFTILQHRLTSSFTTSTMHSSGAFRHNMNGSSLEEVIDLTQVEESDEESPSRNLVHSYRDMCTGERDYSVIDSTPSASSSALSHRSSDSARLTSSESEGTSIDVDTRMLVSPAAMMNVRDVAHAPRSKGKAAATSWGVSPITASSVTSGCLPENNYEGKGIHVVGLPIASYNRARRVLLPADGQMPVVTVSMRSDIQFFHRTARHRISRYSIPNNSVHRHVVDAVMIGDTPVMGHGGGPCQISLIRTLKGHPPTLIELKDAPHKEISEHRTSKSAVNCLAAESATAADIGFFTGGYDKTIRRWSVAIPDESTETELLTSLATIPTALAFRDRALLVGTSKKILTFDLNHLAAKPIAAQLSNAIHHIHLHKQAPNVTVLEVDSVDFQVQIFDDRIKRGFNRTSDCSFGARHNGSGSTRYSRGDSEYSLFAKGYADGTVRVWDFRNCKQPVLCNSYQNMGPIMHTVFSDASHILCYSDQNLAFINLRASGT